MSRKNPNLVKPVPEIDETSLRVVVIDAPRGSSTEYYVKRNKDVKGVAEAAVQEHDTATDTPEGVTAYVYEFGIDDPVARASA